MAKGSFFCENCGAEVKAGAESCPSCGRSFLGVRCPRCGREGSAEDFDGGCPDCGYMAESGRTVESPPRRRRRIVPNRPVWPASRYWILSALIAVAVGTLLYYWLIR